MKRQIIFRGKCTPESKYAGEWVFGSYVQCENGETLIIYAQSDNCTSTYHVIPDSVGQFTGLYDKNGNEIYEGDILRKSTFYDNDFTETYLDRDTVGVVRILPSCGTTICDCIVYETDDPYEEKKMKERIKRAHVVGKRSEVIGNVYDNPELLKQ